MRYSYEKKCPLLFVSITVSGVIWLNFASTSNQFTALLILLSLHSSINYTHSFLPSFNPLTTICSLLSFFFAFPLLVFLSTAPLKLNPSLSFLLPFLFQVFISLLHSPFSLHPSLPTASILSTSPPFFRPRSMSPSLIHPLSVSFLLSPTLHPNCPTPIFLSFCLPSSFTRWVKWIAIGSSQSLCRRAQRQKWLQ